MYSKLTDREYESWQHDGRQGVTVDTFQVHHMAATDAKAVLDDMLTGSKEVSSNYIITSEGELWGVVDENQRAWTSADGPWDRRSITVEIENSSGAPDWRISGKAIKTAARLLTDLRKRYSIKHVLGHRDLYLKYGASYPTYCPGPDTVQRILDAEDGKPAGKPSKPAGKPSKPTFTEETTSWVRAPGGDPRAPLWPKGGLMVRLQVALAGRVRFGEKSRYTGPKDGVGGTNTAKGVQQTIKGAGFYTGPVDGALGHNSAVGVQEYAKRFGDYTGPVDGDPRTNSWAGFCKGLERP